jgi:thiol-disulfide isomerase/thioredoxin
VKSRIALLGGLVFLGLSAGADTDGLTVLSGGAVERGLRPAAGRPLLLHVWASWCRPCVGEWPALAEWLRRVPLERVDVITLSLDDAATLPAAREVVSKLGRLPGRALAAPLDDAFPVIRAIAPDWDGSLPTTLLVDGQGRLTLSQSGATRTGALDVAIRGLVGAVPEAEIQEVVRDP